MVTPEGLTNFWVAKTGGENRTEAVRLGRAASLTMTVPAVTANNKAAS